MPQLLLPTARVQEVLSVIGTLPPAEARKLLNDAELQFDSAELYVLRTNLPTSTLQLFPGAIATAMNTDPMPWERSSTKEVIAATFAAPPWKPWVVAAVALLLFGAQLALAWPRTAAAPETVPLPVVVRVAPASPIVVKTAPAPQPTRAEKSAKKAPKSARK